MTPTTAVATRTVLIADDTAFVRDRFAAALEGAGHRTLTARTGPQVLAAVAQQATRLDLIVLDLRLPQGHGVSLLRNIRRISHQGLSIVVFSGTIADSTEVRELASLGVVGYVNEYAAVQHILPALAPHLFPGEVNRRSSPRVVVSIPVFYRIGNTIASALTLNVSNGGVALRTPSPLELHTVAKVRFRLPGGSREIEGEATVVWADRRVGMGMRFTRLDAANQAAVDEFVNAHFFSNRKA